jgi:hypothetical protein
MAFLAGLFEAIGLAEEGAVFAETAKFQGQKSGTEAVLKNIEDKLVDYEIIDKNEAENFNNTYNTLQEYNSNSLPTGNLPNFGAPSNLDIIKQERAKRFQDRYRNTDKPEWMIQEHSEDVLHDTYGSNQDPKNLHLDANRELKHPEFIKDSAIMGDLDSQTRLQKVLNFVLDVDKPVMSDAQVKAEAVGKDLGTLITVHTNETITKKKDPFDALSDSLSNYTGLSYLAKSLSKMDEEVSKSIPVNNALFRRIYQEYNGKNMDLSNVYIKEDLGSGIYVFEGIDEYGNKFIWDMRDYNYMTVPAVNGIWTGINSPNNGLPVNLLDLFSYFHDIEYASNMFDLEADYRLISRCLQNLDRMAPIERKKAIITIKYFSSIGHSVALYKNGGFYEKHKETEQEENQMFINTDTTDYNEVSSYFDKGLEMGIMEALKTTPIGSADMMSFEILKDSILNLPIIIE